MSIDLEYNFHGSAAKVSEIGFWLEREMPNPPLPDEQRWTIGYMNDGSGRVGIRFSNDEDSTMFALRWGF